MILLLACTPEPVVSRPVEAREDFRYRVVLERFRGRAE